MGKQTKQGTAHESRLVIRAISESGRRARRTAKAGQAYEADVVIEGADMRPAVAWKVYYPSQAGNKRRSLRLVILEEDDFIRMLGLDEDAVLGFYVQAKAAQRISAKAEMLGLREWMKRHT